MKKQHLITQEDLDSLLTWLDPDREKAGVKYETIRQGLIDMYTYRGCNGAEDLADETIDRVARKVKDIAADYEGDPTRYFYGVAKRVFFEYLKKKPVPAMPPPPEPEPVEELERQYKCLERCIAQLNPTSREIILLYYEEKKQAKIELRKKVGRRLNLTPGALRVRAHRIRLQLERCVRLCLESGETKVTSWD